MVRTVVSKQLSRNDAVWRIALNNEASRHSGLSEAPGFADDACQGRSSCGKAEKKMGLGENNVKVLDNGDPYFSKGAAKCRSQSLETPRL